MSIKKIFMTLIVVVGCVIIGALALNVLMPNAATTMVDAVEDQIFKGTGLSFDFNNNGNAGDKNNTYKGEADGGNTSNIQGGVDGFN